MHDKDALLSRDSVRAVLDVVAPTNVAFSIHPLDGSYSNHTQLVKIEFADKKSQQMVVRRYNKANGDIIGKARREFKTLEWLHHQDIPAPKPLYLDDDGTLLGSPGIITEFVPGTQIEAAPESMEWVSKVDVVAKMLARIHATPYGYDLKKFLMNANIEAAWFLKSGDIPKVMTTHPDGEMVWKIVHDLLPDIQEVEPVLIHLDYWSGNILWDNGEISAIVDWEEAAYGDASIDVAYCRMELYLEGMDEAADKFLHVYEEALGKPVANLGFWELAAAARPMHNLDGWITRPFMDERFSAFYCKCKEEGRCLILSIFKSSRL